MNNKIYYKNCSCNCSDKCGNCHSYNNCIDKYDNCYNYNKHNDCNYNCNYDYDYNCNLCKRKHPFNFYKNNAINSLNEVEHFLNTMQTANWYFKFYNLFK